MVHGLQNKFRCLYTKKGFTSTSYNTPRYAELYTLS